jgi:hypothetical protein
MSPSACDRRFGAMPLIFRPPGPNPAPMIRQFASKPGDHAGNGTERTKAMKTPRWIKRVIDEAQKSGTEVKPVWSRDIRPKRGLTARTKATAAE